jgi:hypothetical protein
MTGPTSRLTKSRAFSAIVGILLMVIGLAYAILGIALAPQDGWIWLAFAGCGAIAGGMSIIIVVNLLVKIESNTFRSYNQVLDMHELATRQNELLGRILENTALSDAARSLANRDRECETLRVAIRTDIRIEQWDAALSLADAMEKRFGYTDEAESLRKEINEARVDAMRKRLGEATNIIERHFEAHEWGKAQHEIERLRRALPDEPRVAKLQAAFESKRSARKSALLKAWDSAVKREDVDGAIMTLRELDGYLAREEARLLEESAREVFKAKLLQLGMQFQFAVTEQRWRDALEIGVQITEEFPNSRMAREVEEAMDGLRKRAGMHGDVEITVAQKNQPA